jgi:hypothetical protein
MAVAAVPDDSLLDSLPLPEELSELLCDNLLLLTSPWLIVRLGS